MNYFADCKTKDDVKVLFRTLAKKLHPDAGGRAEDMVELQRQYETWKKPSAFGNQTDWAKQRVKEAEENINKQYAGYGGYKYKNQSDMYREFKQQSNDPRLADYERLRADHMIMSKQYTEMFNENYYLQKEIEELKKKVESQKRKLDKLKSSTKQKSTVSMKKKSSTRSDSIFL